MKRGLTTVTRFFELGMRKCMPSFSDHLPPDPPVELGNGRQRLLERATLAVGRLDSITLLLPDPDIFLYAYVRREAVLSSQIEGTQSSLSDLLLFELDEAPGVPFRRSRRGFKLRAALEHGVARLKGGFPLSSRLIREMHAELLSRGRGSEKLPGEYRRSQNWIGGTRPGNAHFVPPPSLDVEECMAALERFIHDERAPYPALVKAALSHVRRDHPSVPRRERPHRPAAHRLAAPRERRAFTTAPVSEPLLQTAPD